MAEKASRILFYLILPPLILFLAFNKHSKDEGSWYKHVIFSDAAGYYSYLPYWFSKGTIKEIFPDSILDRTGLGFKITDEGKLHTKYTCGVAILQAPFFLVADLLADPGRFGPGAFTEMHYGAVSIAGAFYGWLGLVLIYLVLRRRFPVWVATTVPLIIFSGTNFYWYIIDSAGMSHVYSFFLIALFVFLVGKLLDTPSWLNFILLGFVAGMVMLVRPTNAMAFVIIFFYNVNGSGQFRERIRFLLSNLKKVASTILPVFIVFIPQLIYWKYCFGSYFAWSYSGESFDHVMSPYILHVLFSTNNGLLLYSPVIGLFLLGLFIMMMRGYREGLGVLIIFLISLYLFASWWSWYFGCSYGSRCFVDIYPLMAVGLGYLLTASGKRWRTFIIAPFIIACVCLNFGMIYYYPGCFEAGNWDWNEYVRLFRL